MTYDALIAVANQRIAEELRQVVDPAKLLVVACGDAVAGSRAKKLVITFKAEDTAFGSEIMRLRAQDWLDHLQCRLAPGC